jgi:preprotein translocase subunit YajC
MLLALQLLLADGAANDAQGGANAPLWFTLLTYGPILVLFYFLVLRAPMKRQERERQTLFSNLKENDKVLTSGGIIGTITSLRKDTDEMTLKVDDKVKLRMTKSSVVRILNADGAKEQKEGGA